MLSPYRVLDLTDERGFLAGKILGELGADVIKIEPPGGDPARKRGPYLADVPGLERSLTWLAMNTSKRGAVLDLDRDTGRFLELVDGADVLLGGRDNDRFVVPNDWGLNDAILEAANGGTVHMHGGIISVRSEHPTKGTHVVGINVASGGLAHILDTAFGLLPGEIE